MSQNKNVKRKLKRKYSLIIILICIFFVSFAIFEFILLRFTDVLGGKNKKLDGKWMTSVETTDQIVCNMAVWLNDVNDCDITTDELRDRLADYDIPCSIVFNKKDKTYVMGISEEEYIEISENTYAYLSDTLEQIVSKRIDASDIDMDRVGVSIDELILQTTGLSTEDYLKGLDLKLLPEYENLKNVYNFQGVYDIKDNKLYLENMGEMDFSISNNKLVIVLTDGSSLVFDKVIE